MPSDAYAENKDPAAVADGSARVRPEYRKQEEAFLAPFMGYADDLT
jgi:hypothetical protein